VSDSKIYNGVGGEWGHFRGDWIDGGGGLIDFFLEGIGGGGWCLAKKSSDFRSPEVGISETYKVLPLVWLETSMSGY